MDANLGFIDFCLRYYNYQLPKKGPQFDNRLHNAIDSLVEADRQFNPNVSLVLSFASIEALLCDNHAGITDQIARRATTLLEPEGINRPERIVKIKELYKIRSELVHGSSEEDQSKSLSEVRLLAADCLRAVWEWQEFYKRYEESPDSPKREDFLKEIDDSLNSGKRMPCKTEANWLSQYDDADPDRRPFGA